MRSRDLKEDLRNILWRLGAHILYASKRIGIGGLEFAFGELAERYVPPPGEETVVQIAPEIKMVLPPRVGRARTYALGLYEREVAATFRTRINSGMGVIDVGAFCGYYTLLASRLVGQQGRVYAFEPHPENFGYLVRNISVNGCQNVVPANVAVSAESGPGTLILDVADRHWLSKRSRDGGISVPIVSLDDFFSLRDWPPVDLVKIDAEGSEVSVLRGMRELNRRNPGVSVILEYHPRNLTRAGDAAADLASILRDLGFTTGCILERAKAFSLKDSFPVVRGTSYNLLFTKPSPSGIG